MQKKSKFTASLTQLIEPLIENKSLDLPRFYIRVAHCLLVNAFTKVAPGCYHKQLNPDILASYCYKTKFNKI